MRAVRPALHQAAVAGAMVAWMFASLASAAADADAATLERRVKAAFIAKFPGYVEWPEGAIPADVPLTIGVAGDDAIAEELEQAVAGRAAHDRPIRVQRVQGAEGCASRCQVLFVARGTEPARASELLESARGRPVLTVTDGEGAQPPASVIHFVVVDKRVRFDVSRPAAETNGLRLAAPLLGVAREVRSSP